MHKLYGYLTESNLLTTKQFGFHPKLSTEVALAHFMDRVLEKLDNGMLTGAVFLDLHQDQFKLAFLKGASFALCCSWSKSTIFPSAWNIVRLPSTLMTQ